MAKKVWDYGDEGRRFPVRVGQAWAVGQHIFVCSDLMAARTFDAWLVTQVPTLVYSDPPWNQGNVNSFRTKAGLDRAQHRWEELYQRIAEIGHVRGLPVWVEGSRVENRFGARVPELIRGGQTSGYAPITYYRKNPAGLYFSGPAHPALGRLLSELAGKDDEQTPALVLRAYGSSGCVVDPCAGRGLTSREAQKAGWRSITNELNPVRVSVALSRMVELLGGGTEPQLLEGGGSW